MSDVLVCLEMGNHFQDEGNYPAAAQAFKHAVNVDPSYARSYFCLGNLNRIMGEQNSALTYYNRAIELDGSVPDFLNNRALLHYEMGDPKGSEADFLEALRLDAEHLLANNNLGVLYQCLNQNEIARHYFERAIEIDPSYSSGYCNLANYHSVSGNSEKAIEYFNQAIALAPHDAQAYNAKSIELLLTGDYPQAWQLHEWRWKTNYRPFAQGVPEGKLWLGEESIAGKTILIQSEQGFGDTLQFCRYLPLLIEQGAKVILRTENPLLEILHSLHPQIQIIPMHADPVAIDFYCPILSLPLVFKTTLENIPTHFPYLLADEQKQHHWHKRIQERGLTNKLRVGLVWAGAPRPQELSYRGLNSRRDIRLVQLSPLLKEDIEIYSLQKGESAHAQFQELEPSLRTKLIDWTGEIRDFADTAALIANLDLVVSVDTSTLHLAGALGKPVFLLNRKDTCWRWLKTGKHSPWYPSVTIFRQSQALQWNDVIENIITEIRKLTPSTIPS